MPEAESDNKVIIRAENVSVRIGARAILDQISLEVREGEVVSVVGPNGGGKTTMIKVLVALRNPTSGSVWRMPGKSIGYQPQRSQIDPSMPLSVRSLLTLTAKDGSEENLAETLEELGIGRKLLDAQASSLSGGERQLVMVARSMLCEPNILALDEPGTYCDPKRLSELYAVIERFVEKTGCTTLLVSHDISRVLSYSDHIFCIDKRLLCKGGPEQVTRDSVFEEMFGQPTHTGIYKHRH